MGVQFFLCGGLEAPAVPSGKLTLGWNACVNMAFIKNVMFKAVAGCLEALNIFFGYLDHKTFDASMVIWRPDVAQ